MNERIIDEGAILSQCVFDVDNRFVDLTLRPAPVGSGIGRSVIPMASGRAFILKLTDTSNDKASDCEIELFLTRVDLRTVVNRLTNILDKRD